MIRRSNLQWTQYLSNDLDTGNISTGTALHIAPFLGNLEAAQMLLSSGATTDIVNDYGRTPPHIAALNGHAEVVELLLRNGANTKMWDHEIKTPSMLAVSRGILHLSRC